MLEWDQAPCQLFCAPLFDIFEPISIDGVVNTSSNSFHDKSLKKCKHNQTNFSPLGSRPSRLRQWGFHAYISFKLPKLIRRRWIQLVIVCNSMQMRKYSHKKCLFTLFLAFSLHQWAVFSHFGDIEDTKPLSLCLYSWNDTCDCSFNELHKLRDKVWWHLNCF